jgi:formylglycine-generating enzyme required for sulfatase activity
MSLAVPTGAHAAPRIFISHSHEDVDFCLKLVADLRARLGDDAVWYDTSGGQHGLQGGEAWWDQIVAEITARPYFLVVLSPQASASRWVPQEMGIAFRQHVELGKRLLPVRLADAPRRADWSGIQEFNFAEPRPYAHALDELLSALNVDLAQHVAPPAPAPVVQTPQQALLARLTQEAHTAYGRERWSVTLDKTTLLIARQAMTPALWRERASAALALGDATMALDAAERALPADVNDSTADDIETLRLQGRILLRQGQTERAVAPLTLANTLAPLDDAATTLPLLAELADALAILSRWSDLLLRCGEALYLAPDDPAWLRRRLSALIGLNQTNDALAAAQALATRPDATVNDGITLARLLKAAGAPDPVVGAALDSAAPRALDAAAKAQLVQARRELLAPPPPPIPPERFPARLTTLGFTPQARAGVEWIVPPVCLVPAGQFRLGSDKKRDSQAGSDELNRGVVDLPAFAIARFPVTVAEYACFLNAEQHAAPGDWNSQSQRLDHPVVRVSWYDAFDYASWLAKRTEQSWRLPTEAEWEKEARSDPRDPQGPLGASSERIYPWGDSFDKLRCNTYESGIKTTTPVGCYGPDDPDLRAGRKSGASPCGAEGMAGNVWEWTATEYTDDHSKSVLDSPRDSIQNRCLRGGSWGSTARFARAACRVVDLPDYANFGVGFRLVRVPDSFH